MSGVGGNTIAELERTMSTREFNRWKIYYSFEPFGPWRGDYQTGMIAATIANINRQKGRKAFTPEDFMLKVKLPGDNAKLLKAQLGHLVDK